MTQFYKLEAAGNDFVFFLKPEKAILAEDVIKICDRHLGIGADGVAVLFENGNDWKWNFYNPDGFLADMCGNAARATGELLWNLLKIGEAKVSTAKGSFVVRRLAEKKYIVDFDFNEGFSQPLKNVFPTFKESHLVNVGVTHCVTQTEDIKNLFEKTAELKKFIFSPVFPAQGANLTFFKVIAKNRLEVTTLERGVNDFTLSCGTGVCAAVKIYLESQNKRGPVTVSTRGGDFVVEYRSPNHVALEGPARLVFKGEIS